jgi:hypothetical protein
MLIEPKGQHPKLHITEKKTVKSSLHRRAERTPAQRAATPGNMKPPPQPASTCPPSNLIAAANAIADTVSAEQLNANYIVPSVFDAAVALAAAVRRAAITQPLI